MQLPITSRQADFLNNLKFTAANYRRNCKEVAQRATMDVQMMNENYNITGPSHQQLFELQMNYGKLTALLQQVFIVFDFSHLSDEDRRSSNKNVSEWVALACGPESESFDLYFMTLKD